MLNFLIATLFFSVLLYLLLGGADFGSGILEIFHHNFRKQEQKKIISKAMGPVWEANHMWLILAIVVLFSAFPIGYSTISVYLHLPILMLLLGIILRGCSFTFRNYDAFERPQSQKYYSLVFRTSSVFASFFIGVIAAALILGVPHFAVRGSYLNIYVKPWANVFSFLSGILFCFVFALVASAYLIGETADKAFQEFFARRFFACFIGVAALSTALLWVGDAFYNVKILSLLKHNLLAFVALFLAFLLTPFVLWSVNVHKAHLIRILLGIQLGCVYTSAFCVNFPYLYAPLTFVQCAAPAASLAALSISLLVGFALVGPSLLYLIYLFKIKK